MIAGDGSPTPTCLPGHHCDDDGDFAPRMIAGDGSPTLPACRDVVAKTDGDFAPRMIAGDGSPTPTCLPGRHCEDDGDFAPRMIAVRHQIPVSELRCPCKSCQANGFGFAVRLIQELLSSYNGRHIRHLRAPSAKIALVRLGFR